MITTNIYRISDIEAASALFPLHSTAFTVFKKEFDAERERQLQTITE